MVCRGIDSVERLKVKIGSGEQLGELAARRGEKGVVDGTPSGRGHELPFIWAARPLDPAPAARRVHVDGDSFFPVAQIGPMCRSKPDPNPTADGARIHPGLALCTAPVKALYRETSIPPVDQILEYIKLRYAIRLRRLDKAHLLTLRSTIPLLGPRGGNICPTTL